MKKKDLPELMTKSQIAQMFSCSGRTVERMFQTGLKSIKVRGRRYVLKEALNDYLAQQTA